MSFAVSLFVSIALAALLRNLLKKGATVFYILAIVLCCAAIYFTWNPLPVQLARSIVFAIQKGHVGFSLFTLVMFIGVFSQKSGIRRYFTPIRSELSILASIFMVSHFIPYLLNYGALIASVFSYKLSIALGFIVGIVLLVLLVPLSVTSFNAIRKRMSPGVWKSLQRWSYVFFILAFFHAISFLLVPTIGDTDTAMTVNIVLYAAIGASYCILRLRRAILDKREGRWAKPNAEGLRAGRP